MECIILHSKVINHLINKYVFHVINHVKPAKIMKINVWVVAITLKFYMIIYAIVAVHQMNFSILQLNYVSNVMFLVQYVQEC